MITISKITPPTFLLYAPDSTFLGRINEYELLDARVKIKREQVFGYYLIFKSEKVKIDKNGELEKYPLGVLDTMSGLYSQLLT